MGKTRDFRGPRRRGFDDDTFFQNDSYGQGQQSPPRQFGGGFSRAPAAAEGPVTTATVKWFNGEKGFGFVAGEDGGRDVFIHISVLMRANLATLAEGQRVSMRVVETPKGREAISLNLAD